MINMIPVILFCIGVLFSFRITYSTFAAPGEDKRGAVMSPMYFFAAAAVAHYIGL